MSGNPSREARGRGARASVRDLDGVARQCTRSALDLEFKGSRPRDAVDSIPGTGVDARMGWAVARVVRLEHRRRFTGPVSSNFTLSANLRARAREDRYSLHDIARVRSALRRAGFGTTTWQGEKMAISNAYPLEGGCDCQQVRYRIETPPLFVHCCHCRWCQRESGASFALNAMIEADRVTQLSAAPQLIETPTSSGNGQLIARCPTCRIAVWSNYSAAGPIITFVRVGTLDAPDNLPPDIHIFTSSKQPWLQLPPSMPAVPEYYDRDAYWPPASLARRLAILSKIEAYQRARSDG